MPRTDAVVVGAGVIGCAVALELAGDRKVTVIDPLSGSSGTAAAGAMLGALGEVSSADTAEERVARLRAADEYPRWLDGLGEWVDAPHLRRGTTVVASSGDPDDRRNLEAIHKAAVEVQQPARLVDPCDVDAQPAPDRPLMAALRLPQEGWVDAPALLGALRRALERHPGVTVVRARAASLIAEGDTVTGIVTGDGADIRARHVVICAGASTTRLLDSIDACETLPRVFEGKGTALLLDIRRDLAEAIRTPNRAFACGLHLVPRPGGRVYLGATNRVSTVAGATGHATAGEVHLLLDTALHHLDTRLERADVVSVLHGDRPLSADGRPLIGVTDIDGLAVATGTYRNGVLLAPLAAEWTRCELDAGRPVHGNPFSCPGRSAALRARLADVGSVLHSGARRLTSMFLEPGGRLPYGRLDVMNRLLSTVLAEVLRGEGRAGSLARELLETLPLEEVVPEFAILLARQDEGP